MSSGRVVLAVLLAFSLVLTDGVFATVESQGPSQYGWQQVYVQTWNSGNYYDYARLTASTDRQYYDWGYKPITIFVREEDYWSQDCGWWYVTDTATVSVTLQDANTNTVLTANNQGTTNGQYSTTYTWGTGQDVPGQWTLTVIDSGGNTATVYLYVRGQLNVTSITFSTTPQKGVATNIQATVTDHTGSTVPGNHANGAPTVTAYITGPGGESTVTLTDGNNDGVWTGSWTPSEVGDHKVIVKASDGHNNWVDGRGSVTASVNGDIQLSLANIYNSIIKTALLSIFAFVLPMGFRENRKPLALAAILVVLCFVAYAIPAYADAGKYTASRPSNLDMESNIAASCSQGTGVTGTCHMIDAAFGGLKSGLNTAPDGVWDLVEDYKVFNGQGAFAGSGVPHPGSGRAPASTFPRWVHMQHGNGNWPVWDDGSLSTGGPDVDHLTDPATSTISPSALSGKTDQDIGDAVGTDIGFFRFPYQADNNKQYWGISGKQCTKGTDGDNAIMSGSPDGSNNCNNLGALAYIATPNNPTGNRKPAGKFGGCAYGTQTDDPGAGYTSGCHGLDIGYSKNAGTVTRTDSPACTDCHTTVSGSFTHKGLTATGACDTCHGAGTTLDSTAVPSVKECYECHTSGFTISSTVNTTNAHAGVDCRYCHGHGHNVTIQDVGGSGYGVTCGKTDDTCHGSGAPGSRAVGDIHHGQSTTKDCVDCHVTVTGSSSGHDIRIPACSDCHNSTGAGGNSVAAQPVPGWDSSNAIYHGNGNQTCQGCHGVSDPHNNAITSSTPACTDCHNSSAPAGPLKVYQVHASGVTGGGNLNCLSCHNNVTVYYNNTAYTPNASVHSTNDSKLLPFGMSYDRDDTMTNAECVLCHDDTNAFFSGGNPMACDSCHKSTNAFGVTALTVHSTDMGQSSATIDGVHSASCNTCHSSRDDGMPDTTKTYADAGNNGVPPLHSNTYYTNYKHSKHVDNASASCDHCHYGYSMPGSSLEVVPSQSNLQYNGQDVNFTVFQQSIHANLNNETSTPSGIPAYTAACWACHGDGSDPGDAHPENYSTPLSCAGGVGDCHVSGNPGYGRYNNAFRVTEHTASADSDSGIVTTMDCLTCHNRSIWNESNINDAVNSADDNVSHYGTKTYLKVGSANSATTDCIGCHKESQSESDRWYATYIDSPSSSHFKTGSNANTCYGCHTYPEATPQNFHDEKLRSVGWGGGCNQPGCHD